MVEQKGYGGRVRTSFASATTAIAEALAPAVPFKLLSMMLHLDSAATASASFTLKIDAGKAGSAAYDTLLVSENMVGVSDIVKTWEGGFPLQADDEVDAAWANADAITSGYTITYLTAD